MRKPFNVDAVNLKCATRTREEGGREGGSESENGRENASHVSPSSSNSLKYHTCHVVDNFMSPLLLLSTVVLRSLFAAVRDSLRAWQITNRYKSRSRANAKQLLHITCTIYMYL